MINAVLIFNNKGQPRLTKFYTHLVPNPPFFHPNHPTKRSRIPPSNNASSQKSSPSSRAVRRAHANSYLSPLYYPPHPAERPYQMISPPYQMTLPPRQHLYHPTSPPS
ncbi:hypothetical protein K470DRAFT_255918 [Piedraia hortae CBS 480.64]|uniref:AP complex mu/sigma subunit domain-containing protein n=1 Tax=Piedraia hortae CBS 480.64 TaxID=1314780 RepID=A0A6A7C7K1_9PEZI|nr:hypothetical protein K470DRAFT_255918 [Piedraia hortae CBS 480.64]